MSNIITPQEINAIKFYLGDKEIANSGLYQGGPKAYVTINALLHKGTANEEDKALEGKVVELYGAEHLKSYISLIELVFSAAVKYRNTHIQNEDKDLTSYRVDRHSSYVTFVTNEDKNIEGFFSTCKNGLLPQYAHSKINIVLLDVLRDSYVPYLDLGELLGGSYAKPEEAEILVPFGTRIVEDSRLNLSAEECIEYCDLDQSAPVDKRLLKLTQGEYVEISSAEEKIIYEVATKEGYVKQIMEIMNLLSKGKPLNKTQKLFYNEWKLYLNRYIDSRAARILKEHPIKEDGQTLKRHL